MSCDTSGQRKFQALRLLPMGLGDVNFLKSSAFTRVRRDKGRPPEVTGLVLDRLTEGFVFDLRRGSVDDMVRPKGSVWLGSRKTLLATPTLVVEDAGNLDTRAAKHHAFFRTLFDGPSWLGELRFGPNASVIRVDASSSVMKGESPYPSLYDEKGQTHAAAFEGLLLDVVRPTP